MTAEPYFSVIIPTRNRPAMLDACLSSLGRLEYPRQCWEVIVVDDGSTVAMAAVLERAERDLPLTVLRQEAAAGPAAARNLGAQHARGQYMAFLDDDCAVDPGWLQSYAACLGSTQKDALVGSSANPTPEVIGARVWSLLVAFLYDYWQDAAGNVRIAITNNCVMARAAFFAAGAFDTSFPKAASEDREFSWRFLAQGFVIGTCPAAQVWHAQPNLTALKYLRLQFRYGYYANLFQKKRDPQTANTLAKRFGSESRWRYMRRLFRFARKSNARPDDMALLFVGHVAHYLGRTAHRLTSR